MKKGFTLIELLAVIVILAIIALIATPIVLNIISDTKKSAQLRSADFYLDAVEFSVANATLNNKSISVGTYNILENGNICLEYDEDNKCIDTLEVEVKGETPSSGTITILDGEIDDLLLVYGSNKITKNEKDEIVYYEPICVAVKEATTGNIPEGNYEAGDEYICEVKEGTSYRFFVLSEEDDKVNLLMEKDLIPSINWINKSDYLLAGGDESQWTDDTNSGICLSSSWSNTTKGPITAIKALNDATKDWKGKLEINETYNDKNGAYSNFVISSKARLPKYDEMVTVGCNNGSNSCPLWTVNYMWEGEAQYPGRTEDSNSNAYWLLDTTKGQQCDANSYNDWGTAVLSINHNGDIFSWWLGHSNYASIRPVITVPKADLS